MPGMQGMLGMTGMFGMMKSDSLIPMRRADLDSVARTSPQVGSGTFSAHETVASQMLDAIASDMTMMHMNPDAAWTVLSLRRRRLSSEYVAISSARGAALT
jgi:hypothetical protein